MTILLQKYRPKDINLNIGAGINEGNASLMVHSAMSTLFFNKTQNKFDIINIKIEKMSNIIKKYVPNRKIIHFCKIDVEGSEKDVLLSFDFINYRPKVFCIESLISKESKEPAYKEWEDILKRNNYNFIYHYGANRFYYDNGVYGLKDKFKDMDIIINKFKK